MLTFLKRLFSFFRRSYAKPTEPTVPAPSTTPELYPKVVLGNVQAFNSEKQNIIQAVELLNKVLASETFHQKVLNREFTETEGLTNAQIYDKFREKAVVIDINVFTGSYVQNHVYRTVGYETVPGVVNINRYFVSTPYQFADNIIHEAIGHSTGFSHLGLKSSSIPYQLNGIFEECVKEMSLGDT
jgi:hypothetical protein